jgi:hypothetical protein
VAIGRWVAHPARRSVAKHVGTNRPEHGSRARNADRRLVTPETAVFESLQRMPFPFLHPRDPRCRTATLGCPPVFPATSEPQKPDSQEWLSYSNFRVGERFRLL